MTPARAILCFLSQLLGAMSSAAVISALLPGPLLVSTKLTTGMSIARGVFLEMFLTSLLVFTIFMLAAEKHKSTFLAPVGIGLSFFLAELVGVYFTGGSLNPARSFGPCVVTRSFPGYHYIYWVGPLMGSLLAFIVYKLMRFVEYRTVNPGQEFDDLEVNGTFLERPFSSLIADVCVVRTLSPSDRACLSGPGRAPKYCCCIGGWGNDAHGQLF